MEALLLHSRQLALEALVLLLLRRRALVPPVREIRALERVALEFQGVVTNVLNHTNFAPPAADISNSSTFGILQSAQSAGQGGNRTGQLALRVDF